jgi:tight adherence protein C
MSAASRVGAGVVGFAPAAGAPSLAAVVAGVAAAIAVLAVAMVFAPAPAPSARAATRARRRPRWASARVVDRAAARVGRLVRSAAGRRPDARAEVRTGRVALAAAAGAAVSWPWSVAFAALAWLIPVVRQRRGAARERARLAAELPEVIDLFSLAVGGGLNVRLAVEAVAPRAPPRLSRALTFALGRARAGERLPDALERLPARFGEPLRPLVSILAAADRYGSPLGVALDRLASEARAERRRHAEAAARRVPVKLLFPLVLCVLPAFALLTVVPVLLGTLRSLRL